MAGNWRQLGLGVLAAFALASSAQAQVIYYSYPPVYGGGCWATPYYYYPVVRSTPVYARPTPAPPSARAPAQRLMPPAEAERASTTPVETEQKPVAVEKSPPPAPEKVQDKVVPAEAKVPAPPAEEKTPEKRAPTVTETRFQGAAPAVPGERCQVGFWNLSGRDVTLTIDGKERKLQKDRAITLELPRQFAWKVDQGAEQTERIAAAQATHEVVIRE